MRYIYIAGPYTGPTHDHRSFYQIERHILQAAETAKFLCENGIGFFCPHLHSAHFEVIAPDVKPEYWYELDLHLMQACDALYLLPGWENSKGSLRELEIMQEWGRPIFDDLLEVVTWART